MNAPIVDENRRANSAFVMSLLGALSCCGPLGLAGLITGFRAKSEAEAAGRPVPGKAFVAIALGFLSILELGAGYYFNRQHKQAQSHSIDSIESRLGSKRTAAHLDAQSACDIATEYLIRVHDQDSARCPQPFVDAAPVARLPGVIGVNGTGASATEHTYDICLAKGARWFVISESSTCPTTVGDVAATDEAEKAARSAAIEQAQKEALAQVQDTLGKVRAAAIKRDDAALACPASLRRGDAPYVDLDRLDPHKRGDVAWSFLTKSSISDALNGSGNGTDALALLDAPAIIVLKDEGRELPVAKKTTGLIKDSFSFEAGGWKGWMLVVAPKTAEVLCEAPLSFTNSEKIRYRKGHIVSDDVKVDDALHDDLEDNFKDAAAATVKQLTSGQIKLGVKFLE